MSARPTIADLARFVKHEARLIDEKRFEEWYELFTDDKGAKARKVQRRG